MSLYITDFTGFDQTIFKSICNKNLKVLFARCDKTGRYGISYQDNYDSEFDNVIQNSHFLNLNKDNLINVDQKYYLSNKFNLKGILFSNNYNITDIDKTLSSFNKNRIINQLAGKYGKTLEEIDKSEKDNLVLNFYNDGVYKYSSISFLLNDESVLCHTDGYFGLFLVFTSMENSLIQSFLKNIKEEKIVFCEFSELPEW